MGSVKSQVLLLFDFFVAVKKRGAVQNIKVSVMKLKFYRGFWTADHGRDNRQIELYRQLQILL